ncbi:hypothetical protein BT63DRAFT_222806 [Microthyrium microscopicum]|uniref:Uncharacterized protein n=1 Tax=Microthyrium microscopicum TaxID=703497 RepID=A0A6A6UC24_9PEZI|nr:hypothetical protein BT63DRAFT_222806 [Microthyrium microscopicum]
MKSLVILSSIAALAASAPVADPPKINKDTVPGLKVVPKNLYPKLFDANGKLQSVLSNPEGVALPKSERPEIQIEPSKDFGASPPAGIIRKKIRYGPYRLPPTSEKNWQREHMNLAGMADEYHYNITKPCTECMIASLSANLEDASGKLVPSANAWLHHSAVVIAGPQIHDPVCGESKTETLFSSGNERSVTRFHSLTAPIKSGYRVRPDDTITVVGEYKSEIDTEQYVWLTLTWEIFDGPQPAMKDAHVIWMSTINGLNCAKDAGVKNPFGETNLTAAGVPKVKAFSEHSMPWTSPINGTMLGMGGHLHDGGMSIELYQNGKVLCETKATYASGPAAAGAMGSNHAGGDHLSALSSCPLMKPLKVNDKFWLAANYDFTKHAGSVTESGDLDEIMGVGVILLVT